MRNAMSSLRNMGLKGLRAKARVYRGDCLTPALKGGVKVRTVVMISTNNRY